MTRYTDQTLEMFFFINAGKVKQRTGNQVEASNVRFPLYNNFPKIT